MGFSKIIGTFHYKFARFNYKLSERVQNTLSIHTFWVLVLPKNFIFYFIMKNIVNSSELYIELQYVDFMYSGQETIDMTTMLSSQTDIDLDEDDTLLGKSGIIGSTSMSSIRYYF